MPSVVSIFNLADKSNGKLLVQDIDKNSIWKINAQRCSKENISDISKLVSCRCVVILHFISNVKSFLESPPCPSSIFPVFDCYSGD